MKTNQLMRMAIVVVLWLCFGAGCAKEPPVPENTSCLESGEARLVTKLEGVLVKTLNANFIMLGESVFDNEHPKSRCSPMLVGGGRVCPLNEKSYGELFKKLTSEQPDYKDQQYKVWGSVYVDKGDIFENPLPNMCDILYLIRVDRIERAK